ncbi:MAG TPA: hypothetical protein VK928_02560 [Longimicrobiales bacterium]|nr:hypothetical protein [Longimicrobiales bacterium]
MRDPTVRRPFAPLPFVAPTLLETLLRRRPRENAFIAINNLLAAAACVRDVSPLDVLRACDEYRADIRGPLGARLERLYSDYLLFCLEDRHLSAAELSDLAHLRTVLRIDDHAAARIQDHGARHVYGRSVDEVLEDGVIDPGERDFLDTLRRELALSGRAAGRILERKLQQRS